MPRFRLTLAYVGTRYSGWQIQDKPAPPPTIQGELEKVLRRVTGTLVRVHGAGRTDSGVHADAQTAHLDIPEERAHLDWQRIFNTNLPGDISVLDIRPVGADFHARFDALDKTYTYQFWMNRRFMPPRLRPFAWDCGPLDVPRMREALPFLLGRHDFRSLQNAGTPMENTVRTVTALELGRQWATVHDDHALALRVTADGFLKQMVRNLAGLLVAVGRGHMDAGTIPGLLLAADRQAAPATAPACGLTLTSVTYP